MAEKQGQHVTAVTLTYRGNGVDTQVLLSRDVRLFIKRLRSAGVRVRYLVCGEFGERKGRAHWHALLFTPDALELPLNTPHTWGFWPHGHVFAQRPDEGGLRYVLKYAVKNELTAQRRPLMSKKPPLGYDYLMSYARQIAHQGHTLQGWKVKIPGMRKPYYLHGETVRADFISEYLANRVDQQDSEFLTEWHDAQLRKLVALEGPDDRQHRHKNTFSVHPTSLYYAGRVVQAESLPDYPGYAILTRENGAIQPVQMQGKDTIWQGEVADGGAINQIQLRLQRLKEAHQRAQELNEHWKGF